jgi:uncharacterized protein YjgD (DUF1641 family)
MVGMVDYLISVVKDTQEVRDDMLKKVAYYEAMAEKLTEEATGAVAGLRELAKEISDPEAKRAIEVFLAEVDKAGE